MSVWEKTAAELLETIEDLVTQFAFSAHDNKRKWLHTGDLSALEGAFEVLGWKLPTLC